MTIQPGVSYAWQFNHRGRRDVDVMEVLINGKSQGQFFAKPGEWITHSGTYISRGETELTIEFKALDQGSYGNFVDDARLVRINNHFS